MIPDNIKEILRIETENSPITEFEKAEGGKYPYVILPLESRSSDKYLDAMVEGMKIMHKEEIEKANSILTVDAKGFVVAAPLAKELKLPLIVIRKRDYRTKDQIVIEQKKAYKGATKLYCVGLEKGDRPLFIDDIASSGGTTTSVLDTLKRSGIEAAGVGFLYERGEGLNKIREAGYDAKGLIRLEIKDGKPFVPRFYGD